MIETILWVLAAWLVLGSAVTYAWGVWWTRVNDQQIAEQVRGTDDLDAELRDLIRNHRT